MLAQGQAPPAVSVLNWPPTPPGNSHRMLLAGQGEPHHRSHYLNPAPDKHPHYAPITSKPTPGGTGSNPPLSANLPHPTSLINSGQMGIWPYPTLGPSPPAPSLKHWKIQIYQNIGLKPRKYYSIPQRHLSYCLRWSLLLGCCDTVRFTGNRLTPSIPKRQGTINTSLFLILLRSTFGLFSSTFVLCSSSGVQPTYIFFFQTAFKRQKDSLG